MTAPAGEERRTFRSVKELGVRRGAPPRVGVDPAAAAQTLAERATAFRETLTRAQIAAVQRRSGADPSAGESAAEDVLGVANPFGASSRAFEPNTEMFEMYADAYSRVQGEKAATAETQAAAQLASSGGPGGGTGVSGNAPGAYDGQGKTQAFIDAARSAIGKMYVWGGTSLSTGVDCSGLIYAALRAAGVQGAKRYRAVDYRSLGTQVSAQDARPGDVVYIDNPNSDTDHVGIYLGNGQMIESPTSGQRTKISHVGNRATSYRRILNDDSIGRGLAPGGATTWLYNSRPWNVSRGYSYTAPTRPTGRGVFA